MAKTAGLGSSIDLNDINRDLNIIASDIILENTNNEEEIIWDKWENEDPDAVL